MFKRFIKWKEAGQTFVEYGVVIAVVACIAIAGFASAGNSINNKVTAMTGGSTEEPEPTVANWGVSTDNVLTLSTKPLSTAEGATANGQFDLTGSGYVSGAWGSFTDSITSANIKDHMAPSNTSYWFGDMSSLTVISNIQNLDTSKDTDMHSMFCDCQSLSSLNVSSFDTSKDINMNGMFANCISLTSLDVSHFNTSSVTDMDDMFGGCNSLASLDVSRFDTSNVIDMGYMFYSCPSLTSLDVSSFNTSKAKSMERMFAYCSKLTSLDTSHFVINAGTYTDEMYNGCPAHK